MTAAERHGKPYFVLRPKLSRALVIVLSVGALVACDKSDDAPPADADVPDEGGDQGELRDAGGVDASADSSQPPCDGDMEPPCQATAAQDLRDTINKNHPGGIATLQVPAVAAGTAVYDPPGPLSDPNRYKYSDVKRYLGKMLFHDPVRTVRVNQNKGQPQDLPNNTAFGGTIRISDSNLPASTVGAPPTVTYGATTQAQVDAIVEHTVSTGSCGSCHIGEAGGKAGQQLNFNTGGEGRGYVDIHGKFVPRRRPQSTLAKFRDVPLFAGDVGVDALPTLGDVWFTSFSSPTFPGSSANAVTTPAFFFRFPQQGLTGDPRMPFPSDLTLVATGRLDQIDSVGRESPAMIGFAFNNRLLFGGFGGEPHDKGLTLQPSFLFGPNGPAGVGPFPGSIYTNTTNVDDPAQENLNLLLLDAHRMLFNQAAVLKQIPAYVALFKAAFPELAAAAKAGGDETAFIDDFTESRAQAAFLRTTVTSTPFDSFLAGNDDALTPAQIRGAQLFFGKVADGGAGCFSCHSGPMLNKQSIEAAADIQGVGKLVEENFANVGIGDHPVQALTAFARGKATAYHAEDTGRQEITLKDADAFKFRSLTLRQLKEAFTFFHSGDTVTFPDVRAVVQYFNKGIPQDPTAGAAATLDERFAHPRGPSTAGLGLTDAQVDDLTEFLVNGLYDPEFKKAFQPDPTDELGFSKPGTTANKYLAGVPGLIDGLMPSTLAVDDNDGLARRDQGLQFLDVTSSIATTVSSKGTTDTLVLANRATTAIDTHLIVILKVNDRAVTLDTTLKTAGTIAPGADGIVSDPNTIHRFGDTAKGVAAAANLPYYRIVLPAGQLLPGQGIALNVKRSGGAPSAYTVQQVLSGVDVPALGRTP